MSKTIMSRPQVLDAKVVPTCLKLLDMYMHKTIESHDINIIIVKLSLSAYDHNQFTSSSVSAFTNQIEIGNNTSIVLLYT